MNNLKKLRELYGMQQKDFAASLGIAKSTYSQYENGHREPRSDFWETVSEKYRVSIDFLMGLTDNPKATKFAETFQISPEEKRLVSAWRNSDRRAKEDVAHALRAFGFSYEPKEKDEKPA